jgi:hypothetical protein
MAKCSSTTLVMGRPSQSAFNQLSSSSSCGMSKTSATVGPCNTSTSPFGCDVQGLGPRDNRDKVREKLRDYVLLKLGAPTLDLELDEQQVQLAIDEALYVVEEYAPREFFSYYTFATTPGKSVYEMPPDVGYIRNVYYKTTGSVPFNSTGLDGQIPLEYFWGNGLGLGTTGGFIDPSQPIFGRMGEWMVFKQSLQTYNRLSSQLGGWEFVGGYKHIKLYPIPCGCDQVIVHYIQRCKDWDRMYQSMAEGAYIYAGKMLAEIRSKYTNIPGPQGGQQLNGQDLMQRMIAAEDKWLEKLIYRWGEMGGITWG